MAIELNLYKMLSMRRDMLLWKVVTDKRESSMPIHCRPAQQGMGPLIDRQGTILKYHKNTTVFSSFATTAGIYCFADYEAAQRYQREQVGGDASFIVQVKAKSGTRYYVGITTNGEQIGYCVEGVEVMS